MRFMHFSLLLLFFSVFLFADQNLKVVTFPIPVMVESAEKGVFIELVKTTAKKAGLTVEISVLPTKRAIETFMGEEADMLFPGIDIQFYGLSAPRKSKELIYVKQDFAFTLKDKPVIATIGQLKGKTVGITSAYPYVKEILFSKDFTIEPAESDEINVRKLINNRIDVFIVEEKSGLGAFKKENAVDQVHYNTTEALSKQDVYFAFQNTDLGAKLENAFSAALAALKADGTFGAIMKKAE